MRLETIPLAVRKQVCDGFTVTATGVEGVT